jgi:paraquat-inducible protein B
LPEAQVIKRDRISLVWLLPVLAVLVGGWLVYKTLSERGPTITIEFKTAAGLEAGKTKVKFKDVDIGQVTAIDVSDDLSQGDRHRRTAQGSEKFLTDRDPLLGRASAHHGEPGLRAGDAALRRLCRHRPRWWWQAERHFVGLPDPPVITTDEPGTAFRLRSQTLGSLNLGSPVYYRQIQVGQVVDYRSTRTVGGDHRCLRRQTA